MVFGGVEWKKVAVLQERAEEMSMGDARLRGW